MAAEDAFFKFEGQKVRVRVVEPDTELKHRVFVISSPVTAAFNWRKLVPELTQNDCLVALMDMPGFGMSDCGEGISQEVARHAGMAWGIIDALDSAIGGGDSTWHIMGHGLGCQTALAMANMHPDSVSSQVYIAPVMNTENGIRTGFSSHSRWYDSNIASPQGYRALMEKLFGGKVDDYVMDAMCKPFRRKGAKESFLDMLSRRTTVEPFMGFAPTMALWGDRDILMDEKARAAFKKLMPEAETHVIKEAGHIPMETHSHALRDFLRGWIRYVG